MEDITAVILAAGLGMRMGPRGRLHPKGFLRLGGRTLIEQSVESLRARGIGRIVIVTGHLSDQYQALYGDSDITLLHSERYATTGSLRSLMTALEVIAGPIVIVESDLVYEPRALGPIDPGCNRLVASGPTGAGDEVYVWATAAQGGPAHLVDMSKDSAHLPGPWEGELVGITCLTASAVAQLCRVAAHVLEKDPAEHYEYGLVTLAREAAIEVARIDDLAWAEIDDEAMLERAASRVFPRIEAARGRR